MSVQPFRTTGECVQRQIRGLSRLGTKFSGLYGILFPNPGILLVGNLGARFPPGAPPPLRTGVSGPTNQSEFARVPGDSLRYHRVAGEFASDSE